eukprot:scaffold224342_cov49-Tisochrysis_lutea.AAC.1
MLMRARHCHSCWAPTRARVSPTGRGSCPGSSPSEHLAGSSDRAPCHGSRPRTVNGKPGRRELLAHRHEESVEDVDRLLALDRVDVRTVEAASQLHRLRLPPYTVQTGRVEAQVLTRIHGIIRLINCVLPVEAELLLELVVGHVKLRGLEDRRLGRNRIVVLIDEFVAVDLLRGDVALRKDSDSLCLESRLDQLLRRLIVGVRLDEDKRLSGAEVQGLQPVGHLGRKGWGRSASLKARAVSSPPSWIGSGCSSLLAHRPRARRAFQLRVR